MRNSRQYISPTHLDHIPACPACVSPDEIGSNGHAAPHLAAGIAVWLGETVVSPLRFAYVYVDVH